MVRIHLYISGIFIINHKKGDIGRSSDRAETGKMSSWLMKPNHE